MSFQHDIKLCGSVSKQNYSTLSERHLLNLWRNDSSTLLTQGTLGYIWITIAVVGFILNIAQLCWVLSRGKKSVIDVFIVSLAVSKLKIPCCRKVLGQQMKFENKPDRKSTRLNSSHLVISYAVFCLKKKKKTKKQNKKKKKKKKRLVVKKEY